jgi:hypothetical protein
MFSLTSRFIAKDHNEREGENPMRLSNVEQQEATSKRYAVAMFDKAIRVEQERDAAARLISRAFKTWRHQDQVKGK